MMISDSGGSPPGVSSVIEADVTARNLASEQSDLSLLLFVSFRRRKDLNDKAIKTRHTARLNFPPLSPLESKLLSAGELPVTISDVTIVGTANWRPPDAILGSNTLMSVTNGVNADYKASTPHENCYRLLDFMWLALIAINLNETEIKDISYCENEWIR